MRHFQSYETFSVFSALVFLLPSCIESFHSFNCPPVRGEPLPAFPASYSSNVRLNVPELKSTIEMRVAVHADKEAVQLRFPKRTVQYIRQGDQLIILQYADDTAPSCTVKSSKTLELEAKDAGPNMIIGNMWKVLKRRDQFSILNPSFEGGLFMKNWEGCFKDPHINVSVGYTEIDWSYPSTSALNKQRYPSIIEAAVDGDQLNYLVAVFNNFDPKVPDMVEFQPPENAYCQGFRSDRKPPSMPNTFSYDAELIVFESAEGIAPVVSHRKVYYDYTSQIVRTDFYDPLANSPDIFSQVTAKGISIIHDFNSSIQYRINPDSGKCSVDDLQITMNVVEFKETKGENLLTGKEFFDLDARKISYNGQFKTRGYEADVFTALVPHLDGSAGKSFYAWYFSTGRTQIVEKDKVERNVLLRIVIQPEARVGFQGRTIVNFYNFQKEEPNPMLYDISGCYRESLSKTFVITFPANNELRGQEKSVKLPIHLALKDLTGLSTQRIFVSEVIFNDKFMFVEFKLLETSSVFKNATDEEQLEVSLQEAINKIKESVQKETFRVTLSLEKQVVVLVPLSDGFNEFSGDRNSRDRGNTYKEGSVIALTVGMLFLGVVLGGVAINLVISRKYGVSLFQKSMSGMNRFDNPLNESSM